LDPFDGLYFPLEDCNPVLPLFKFFELDLWKLLNLSSLFYFEVVLKLVVLYCPSPPRPNKSAKRFRPLNSGFGVLQSAFGFLNWGDVGIEWLELATDIDGFFASSLIWLKSVFSSSKQLFKDVLNVLKADLAFNSVSSYLLTRKRA
jgi:hypothetical protein